MKNRKKQRLAEFDYSTQGVYFITACVQGMQCCLGDVTDGKIILNETGEIVDKHWHWLFEQFNYIEIDEFVVMPNHFHGIIHIVGNGLATRMGGRDRSLQGRKIKSLSELIGAFKTTSSKMIHKAGYEDFKWQKSYFDRVVRDEKELQLIREYIVNNPLKWELEKDNSDINGNRLFVGNGRDRSLQIK